MYIVNVNLEMKPKGMDAAEFLFVVTIAANSDKDGFASMTTPQIAVVTGMSERNISYVKKSCKEKGFIAYNAEKKTYEILCKGFGSYYGSTTPNEATPMTTDEIVGLLQGCQLDAPNPPKNFDKSKLNEYIRIWADWFVTKGVSATLPQLQKRFLSSLLWVTEKHKALGEKVAVKKYTPEYYEKEDAW